MCAIKVIQELVTTQTRVVKCQQVSHRVDPNLGCIFSTLPLCLCLSVA